MGCQGLVINLSLKNLGQAIRLGWDLCPWGKSPVWWAVGFHQCHGEFKVVTSHQEWHSGLGGN